MVRVDRYGVVWGAAVLCGVALFFLVAVSGGECSGVDRLGNVGGRVLYAALLYVIGSIYLFHIDQLQGGLSRAAVTAMSAGWAAVALGFPMLMLNEGAPGGCVARLSWPGGLLLGGIIVLATDYSGEARRKLVAYYEEKVRERGGDMFLNYPPKDLLDMLIPFGVFVAVLAAISWLWKGGGGP